MSSWKIAAAQYTPLNASSAEHVAHHLEYIELAARQQCELLVFPSLSLSGCSERSKSLPAPLTRRFYSRSLMRPIPTI